MPMTSLMNALIFGASNDIGGSETFKVGKKKFYIDTRYARDICDYETCIFVNDDGGTNVEHYKTIEKAKIGHKKWVKLLKKKPNTKLTEVNEYGF